MKLIDTDVMIWYLRGNVKAKVIIENSPISMSDVVYMELLQGMRNKQELALFKTFIKERKIECLPLTPEITSRAIYFLELFVLSHGLRMADALIAATADIYSRTLITANDAHYRMISSLPITVFRP
ncbi:MAG: type II toxin-antitoxin system VapC family toxin [Legionellales bacterium]|nr:type II toxin-antitoxin system VapC family toxin [Legionellales bacterium]